LLISPLVGFVCAALLLLVMRRLIPNKKLYEAPEGTRSLRPSGSAACSSSRAPASASRTARTTGRKGMGLIMLILIGTVPTAYALNHAVTAQQSVDFVAVSAQASEVLGHYAGGAAVDDPRAEITRYVRTRKVTPETIPAVRAVMGEVAGEVATYKELKSVPPESAGNVRNDLYLVGEALRFMDKKGGAKGLGRRRGDPEELRRARGRGHAVHPAVGQDRRRDRARPRDDGRLEAHRRDGRREDRQDHLTYAQGAAAEITAMMHHRGSRTSSASP
jgi:PiT family inorganic phosphate transporter